MYTEDDDKVTVKKNNSNIDYDDFYTSFNDIDENEAKEDKKKNKKNKTSVKKKEPEKKEKETDYKNFYDTGDNDEEVKEDHTGQRNKLLIFIVGLLLVIAITVVALLIIKNSSKDNKVPGDIELAVKEFNLTPGTSEYISYKIVDTEEEVKAKFISSDSNIVTVDEDGKITAVGVGEATISIEFTIGGTPKGKTCTVKVTEPVDTTPHELKLNLKFNNGSDGKWTNKDVTISVEASTDIGLSSLKYVINCTENCTYTDVVDNKIAITNNGTTKVTVVATDTRNQEVKKEVTVKIDKEAPTATYSGSKNIESDKDVEVCASCSDSISGCKQNKVCKKFTSSKSNQTITVTDNAGNSKQSSSFNVTINKKQAPCELKVSSDGTISATLRESAKYYGFNSNYSGTNELSGKVDINASKAGESGAKVVKYYVLNKNGSGGICYITVIKECSCTDKSSTDPNCPVTCTFRAS